MFFFKKASHSSLDFVALIYRITSSSLLSKKKFSESVSKSYCLTINRSVSKVILSIWKKLLIINFYALRSRNGIQLRGYWFFLYSGTTRFVPGTQDGRLCL